MKKDPHTHRKPFVSLLVALGLATFLSSEKFSQKLAESDLVIAHAGMGSILPALKNENPILVMPRFGCLGETRNDKVYPTFDDGPDPVNTPKTLDTLRGHGAKTTSFFIGEAVEKHPEIVKRIEAEGHAIGSHGFQHLHPRESSPRASFHDIKKGILALREIGVASSLWRPPYGKASLPTLICALYEGLDLVHLTLDPRDYDPSKTPSTLNKWLSTNTIPRKRHSVAQRKTLATGREEYHA